MKFKRLLSFILSIVLVISCMTCIGSVTASAAAPFDITGVIAQGKTYDITLSKRNVFSYYRVNINSTCELKIGCASSNSEILCRDIVAYLYDSKGNELSLTDCMNGSNKEYSLGTLSKGTYYIGFVAITTQNGLLDDFYISYSTNVKQEPALKVTLQKGETIKLGAVIGTTDKKAAWSSSNKKIASVSSKGKITAKKNGTAIIRAVLNNGEYIEINVEVTSEHRYEVFDLNYTWEGAKAYCEALGGHLVTITSKKENTKVLSLIKGRKLQNYWFGTYKDKSTGKWRWVTDEEYKNTYWGVGQPDQNTNDESYGRIFSNTIVYDEWIATFGDWNDSSNDGDLLYPITTFGFICEWDE